MAWFKRTSLKIFRSFSVVCMDACSRSRVAPCDLACPLCLQEAHIAKLQGALDTGGDASLQNAMNLAIESLRSIPPYGHREVSAFAH